MRNFYLAFCFVLFSLAGTAQTTIWLGGSSDWNDPANWSDGIPATGFTVTIPSTPPNGANFPVYNGGPLIDYTIQIFGGSLTLDAVVYNTGTLLNSGGGTIINNQIFVNAGMVQFNNNDGTFTNNGVVDNYGLFTNAGTSVITNTAGNNFNNFGEIENFGLITNDGTFLNTGSIVSTSNFVNNGTLNNKGLLDSAFGSTFTSNSGATFNNEAGAIFEINGTFTNAGAIVSDGSFFIQTAGATDNSGTIVSNGAFDLSGPINNTGTFTNNDLMLINDSGQFTNNNVFTNNGTVTLSICGQIVQNANNTIAGTILSDGIIYAINGAVNVTDNLDFGSEFTDLSQRKSPDVKCRSGIAVFLDENGNGTLSVDAIDKNSFGFCGAALATRVLSQNTFTTADIGVQEITLTITDEFGFGGSCSGFINVFPYTPPVTAIDDADIDLTCPEDIVVQVQPGAFSTTVTWDDPVPTTNCVGAPTTGGGCPTTTSIAGYNYLGEYEGSKYFLSTTTADWHAANNAVTAEGGQMLSISDAAENDFIRNQMVSGSSVWLGLTDEASEGNWEWTTGESTDYFNWASGEPNEGTSANHARLRQNNGQWTDRNESNLYYYVLEFACDLSPCQAVTSIPNTNFIGEFNNSKYFISTSSSLNYAEAEALVGNSGGHLVTISDVAENEYIRSNLPTGSSAWLGYSDVASEGNYVWVTGEPTTYTNWNNGEPNDSLATDNYARMRQDNGAWTDRNGATNHYYAIIEIDCQELCQNVDLAITFDNYPEDISWDIKDTNGAIVASGGNYGNEPDGSTVTAAACLEVGCYDITIYDSYGDGLCCSYGNGGYALTDVNGTVLASGAQFTNQSTTNFCITSSNGGGGTGGNGLAIQQISGAVSGSEFPVGESQVAYEVTDNCGNQEICIFNITVEANPADIVLTNCPTEVVVNALPGAPSAVASWTAPTATSNCFEGSLTKVTQSFGPISGAILPIGTQPVTYTVEDSCGNFSSCVFPVTIVATAATFSLDSCPGDISLEAPAGQTTAVATWALPTGTTDCYINGVNVVQLVGPTSGSVFPIGTTTVAYVLSDDCGNSDLCSFTVTVGESCPAVGTACDDGDATTENDVEDGNCNCAGTPIVFDCPALSANIGDACDDGDATTENDVVTATCNCAGTPIVVFDCPALSANIGDACDDGNASTENDVVTATCNCAGTPIVTFDCPALSANIGDACDDNNASTENDVVTANCTCAGTPINTGGGCTTTSNLALDGTATESSEQFGALGGRAIDGNTNGNFWNGNSVALTMWEAQPWIEIDLGQISNIESVNVYNRDDCCESFLTNYHILISDVPFTSTSLAATQAQAGVDDYFEAAPGGAGAPTTTTTSSTGRYVRIQLEGTSFLGLAEIEIIGCVGGGGPCPAAGTACDDNNANTENDIEDGNCNCAGTPINTVDCPALSANIGDACNDNNANTENDVVDANCNCVGTPINTVDCPVLSANIGDTCNDNNANTENDVVDANCNCVGTPINTGGGCTTTTNLALGGTATESSEQFSALGSRAIDGNTNGDFWNGNSVALTKWESQPWIEIDLGQVSNIESFNVYNRTDCCEGFLTNYHILVSDVPFTSTNLATTLAQAGVVDIFENTIAESPTAITAPANTTGRYVRIQLEGSSFLGVAELEIIGCVGGGGPCPAAGTACDDGDANTENDVEDGNCGCAGTPIPCPVVGTACNDNNPNTINDVEDGNCNCAGIPIGCPAAGTPCDDGNANTENDVEDGNCGCAGTPINTGGCTTTTNLALDGTASQINTLTVAGFTGNAENAIDGDTNGVIFDGTPEDASVTGTQFVTEPWWEVDLGASYLIETINAYNRVDGANKTESSYILVSNNPFTANDLAGARAEADYEQLVPGQLGLPSVVMPNIAGRYVRIHMIGSGYLVLAEVEVFGCTAIQQFAVPNMLDFNVEKDGRTSKVDWVMLKDVNVDYYDVEVSTDGYEFRVLDVIEADQVSSARNYNTVDTEPVHGYNYYRLRVNNLDGSAYYSNIRRVNFDIDFGAVTVFPNPTNDYIHISLKDFAGKAGTIEINNSLGQQVGNRVYQAIPSVPATFDVSKLIGGVYSITVKVDGHRSFTKKFIVSNL